MIELPEARSIAQDLRKELLGKTVTSVGGNYTDHKFTFYQGDPNTYAGQLVGKKVTALIDRNFYVEIELQNRVLFMRDGANIRYFCAGQAHPQKSKLLLEFNDGSFINVTTSMYACIGLYDKGADPQNKYYALELSGIGALDEAFTYEYFRGLLQEATQKLSTKAFLATEQRILGVGNGVVQDILFNARLHPKRKMNTLSEAELKTLYHTTIDTLRDMTNKGGRDTEKSIYGTPGGYQTILCSRSYKSGCPLCHAAITKEQYLGGSIYYCPNCQKLGQ